MFAPEARRRVQTVVAGILPALESLSVGRRAVLLLLVIAFARNVGGGMRPRPAVAKERCNGSSLVKEGSCKRGIFVFYSPDGVLGSTNHTDEHGVVAPRSCDDDVEVAGIRVSEYSVDDL